MSDELDEIRQKRIRELEQASSGQQEEELRRQQQEALEQRKQAILRAILSEKAHQRLTNIKLVKPEMAENIENQLIQLAQSGRVPGGQISEEQLLLLLKQIQDRKRDSSITFKRV